MTQENSRISPKLQIAAQRVVYIGPAADEVCKLVTQHVGEIDILYETSVQAALSLVRARPVDTIIVDQRDTRLATKLIVPLFASLQPTPKLVVVSQFQDVSQYLAVPGVARVLSAPIVEAQLLRVLGLKQKSRHFDDATPDMRDVPRSLAFSQIKKPEKRRGIVSLISDRFMSLVSTLYKRAAFVMLLTLFFAFSFYGLLIGYFLLSSTWGAPMTLTRGHELVNKVEREITEAKVALGQTEQKITEANLQKLTAEQELGDAKSQVKTAIGTIERELKLRNRQDKVQKKSLGRMTKVKNGLANQLKKDGMAGDLAKLYNLRLINKTTYNAGSLGLLGASQNLVALEGQIDAMEAELETSTTIVEILANLRTALKEGGPVSSLAAASPELLLLTKQSLDARAVETSATATIASNEKRIAQLAGSQDVLQQQISGLEASVLGRAIDTRIDVVFVPYTNQSHFRTGQPLYSCLLTVVWCKKVGIAGEALPGEVNSVHPFFGKPIRGFFVEAKINDPEAATREIIHGTRAPFFF